MGKVIGLCVFGRVLRPLCMSELSDLAYGWQTGVSFDPMLPRGPDYGLSDALNHHTCKSPVHIQYIYFSKKLPNLVRKEFIVDNRIECRRNESY